VIQKRWRCDREAILKRFHSYGAAIAQHYAAIGQFVRSSPFVKKSLCFQRPDASYHVANDKTLNTHISGRGAPEIDILEAMPGDETLGKFTTTKRPYYSTSLQVRENSSLQCSLLVISRTRNAIALARCQVTRGTIAAQYKANAAETQHDRCVNAAQTQRKHKANAAQTQSERSATQSERSGDAARSLRQRSTNAAQRQSHRSANAELLIAE
jgi:hypothetical protein